MHSPCDTLYDGGNMDDEGVMSNIDGDEIMQPLLMSVEKKMDDQQISTEGSPCTI